MDRLIGPVANEAQLTPVAYVLCTRAGRALIPGQRFPAAPALGAKNAVELLQRELGKRIVLVHEDRVRRRLVGARRSFRSRPRSQPDTPTRARTSRNARKD